MSLLEASPSSNLSFLLRKSKYSLYLPKLNV